MLSKLSVILGGAALVLSAAMPAAAYYRPSQTLLSGNLNVNYADVTQIAQAQAATGGNINIAKQKNSFPTINFGYNRHNNNNNNQEPSENKITTGPATATINNGVTANTLYSGLPAPSFAKISINANANIALVGQQGTAIADSGLNKNVGSGENTITTGSATATVNQVASVNNLQVNGLF